MMSSFCARRKLAVILLALGVSIYLFASRVRRATPMSELSVSSYVLVQPHLVMNSPFPNLATLYSKASSNILQHNFIPSFFVTSPVLGLLLSDDSYYARIMSLVSHEPTRTAPTAPVFKCVCGRISDDCVCCGILSSCPSPLFATLPSSVCAPLILFHPGDNIAATLCLNVTYLPLRQRVRSAGFLLPTSTPASSPSFSLIKYMNQSLVLFDKHYSPLFSATDFCVENSKTNPEAAICIHFLDMKYSYDSVSDHTTTFTGCAEISIVLKKQFIVSKYPRFCFRAYRGAIGDVDRAEQAVASNDHQINISSTKAESVINDEPQNSSYSSFKTSNLMASTSDPRRPVVFNIHDAQAVIP
ncbi:unnamed protein product [Dicrocoelium dendriticum]|nr:unnamed protein product [Dicrocoelium dendriticum]